MLARWLFKVALLAGAVAFGLVTGGALGVDQSVRLGVWFAIVAVLLEGLAIVAKERAVKRGVGDVGRPRVAARGATRDDGRGL